MHFNAAPVDISHSIVLQGFLQLEMALLQTIGHAARNVNGTAIFYASRVMESMHQCIEATKDRRECQIAYNGEFGYEC